MLVSGCGAIRSCKAKMVAACGLALSAHRSSRRASFNTNALRQTISWAMSPSHSYRLATYFMTSQLAFTLLHGLFLPSLF
jgi:hypothetical protein